MAGKQGSVWKKLILWVSGLVVLCLFIWFFLLIQGTQEAMVRNRELLLQPDFELEYFTGNPERFKQGLDDAKQWFGKDIERDKYLWIVTHIRNEGNADATGMKITSRYVQKPDVVLINTSWWGSEPEMRFGDGGSVTVKMASLQKMGFVTVFAGFSPGGPREEPYTTEERREWAREYRAWIESTEVMSYGRTELFYGDSVTGEEPKRGF